MKNIVFASAFLVLFFSTMANAQRDQEINVKLGETKTADASGFRVNFVDVLEDSRCPEGADCFWEGVARIQVTLEPKSGDAMTVEFATIGENQNVIMAGYRIHLIRLDPKPSAEKAPETKEYSALFRFEKL